MRSIFLIAAARTFAIRCPGPAAGSGTSVSSGVCPNRSMVAAFITPPIRKGFHGNNSEQGSVCQYYFYGNQSGDGGADRGVVGAAGGEVHPGGCGRTRIHARAFGPGGTGSVRTPQRLDAALAGKDSGAAGGSDECRWDRRTRRGGQEYGLEGVAAPHPSRIGAAVPPGR